LMFISQKTKSSADFQLIKLINSVNQKILKKILKKIKTKNKKHKIKNIKKNKLKRVKGGS